MYLHEAANELNRFLEGATLERWTAFLAACNYADRMGNPEFEANPWPPEEVRDFKIHAAFQDEEIVKKGRELWKQYYAAMEESRGKTRKRHPLETVDNDTPDWMIFLDEMLSDPAHYSDMRLKAKAFRNREVVDTVYKSIQKEAQQQTDDLFTKIRKERMPFKNN